MQRICIARIARRRDGPKVDTPKISCKRSGNLNIQQEIRGRNTYQPYLHLVEAHTRGALYVAKGLRRTPASALGSSSRDRLIPSLLLHILLCSTRPVMLKMRLGHRQ